jgi:AcrR family transcriptional regulator
VAKGRPRAFDTEEALDRALNVFWRKGYEGTSLPDLTRAMGINRPSLYAAFGNKESLFRKVLDRYAEVHGAYVRKAIEEPTASAVVERLFRCSCDLLTHPQNPGGCLIVQGALACGKGADCIRRELAGRRAGITTALRQRFERAKAEGDLGAATKPADLARYVATVLQGMAVQAASGATRSELRRTTQIAMRAWPG